MPITPRLRAVGLAIPPSRRRTCRPGFDRLEERRVPAVFVVNSLADTLTPPAGIVTLRDAIAMADVSAGTGVSNVIELSVAGTYPITNLPTSLGSYFEIDVVGSYNLTIENTSPGRTVVDGGGLTQVFSIDPLGVSEPLSTVTFKDLTITDGEASGSGTSGSGGGIDCQGGGNLNLVNVDLTHNFASQDGGGLSILAGHLTATNCTFADNYAAYGGGVYANSYNSAIKGGFFQGNIATSVGGGLDLLSTIATLNGIDFSDNVATDGGAIQNLSSSLTIQYCTIDGNHAFGPASSTGFGGGLYVPTGLASTASISIANTLFLNNAANDGGSGMGGAIYQGSGKLTIQDSQLSGNRADAFGGAISFLGSILTISGTTIDHSTATADGGGALFFAGTAGTDISYLTNDTLTLNSSPYGGGIYDSYMGDGVLALLDDTINANYATQHGGGIYQDTGGMLTIGDSIIAQNTVNTFVGTGPDVATGTGLRIYDTGGNLVGTASGSIGFNPSLLIGTGTILINPEVGPLLDNGSLAPYTSYATGGTSVMYGAGAAATFRVVPTEALMTSSPGFGQAIQASGTPTIDQRGFPRPAISPSMGAYQPKYAATSTPAQLFAEDLYEVLLDRPGDPGGVAYWSTQVNVNGSNTTLARTFETTGEYRQDQINLIYETNLSRPVDGGGLGYWQNYLMAGGTLAQVQEMILGSQEYFDDKDDRNATVVESYYENILDRIPTGGEVNGWIGELQLGLSSSNIAADFLFSPEGAIDLILADYTAILGRVPAGSDEANGLTVVSGSTDPLSALIANLLGSPESFIDRA